MKAQGLARIGKDAEVRYTPSGTAVANVSLAFTFGKKGDDGKRPTQWVDASLWGQRADGTTNTKMVARLADLEFVSDGSDHKPTQKPQNEAQSRPAPAPQGSGFDD